MKFLAAVLVLLAALQAARASRCALRPKRVDAAFCARPPVDAVALPKYLGTWYQIFANGNALRFTRLGCVTANYKPRPDGGVAVLNCQAGPGARQASCARAVATKRAGAGADARLQVKFPGSPPGKYNIAALLGDKEYGYYAAAVYSCDVRDGRARTVWFMLARNPYRPYRTLWELQHRLRCKGYDVYKERFFFTRQGAGCKYFFDKSGFKVDPPRRSSGGRPGGRP